MKEKPVLDLNKIPDDLVYRIAESIKANKAKAAKEKGA